MQPDPESIHSPRLERLLRSRASQPVPVGLADRVFRASVTQLPRTHAPAVIGRVSFRWLAAAAALLLAAGLAMRLSALRGADETPGASLAVVLEVSDAADLGDDLPSLKALHGARFSDLDDEMSVLLADGRVGR